MRFVFYILGFVIAVMAIYLVVVILIDRPRAKNEQIIVEHWGKRPMPLH